MNKNIYFIKVLIEQNKEQLEALEKKKITYKIDMDENDDLDTYWYILIDKIEYVKYKLDKLNELIELERKEVN
jgi:hypothetical protein